jgi:D-aminoacyl-tRNA deacylase
MPGGTISAIGNRRIPLRSVVQRVSRAAVRVDGITVGAIGRGFLVLVGVTHADGRAEAEWLARKIAGLRIYEDDAGKMNLGLTDVGGEVLVVSQFTLYGDARKGRRPSFTEAARPEQAEPLVDYFANRLREEGLHVESGVFGAMMEVELVNDGPVTLWMDTEDVKREA